MFGQGSGGTTALLAASVDSRIKAINILDPWGNWPEWMAKSTLIPEDKRPDDTTPQSQSRGPGPYAGIAAADAAGSSAGHAL